MSFARAAAMNMMSCLKVCLKKVKVTPFYDTKKKKKKKIKKKESRLETRKTALTGIHGQA